MPDRTAHYSAGLVAAVAALPVCRIRLQSDLTVSERLGCVYFSLLGSRLPDLIEEPDGPDHRGFFHSILCGALLSAGSTWMVAELDRELARISQKISQYCDDYLQIPIELIQQWSLCRLAISCLTGLTFGYESHLVLDGMTQKSLPLCG